MKETKIRVTIMFTPTEKAELEQIAKSESRSVSTVVAMMVRKNIEERKDSVLS